MAFWDNFFKKKSDSASNAVNRIKFVLLPRSFHIPTPVGNYAPDWAIAFNDGMGIKHVFFIAETKGSMDSMQLKGVEKVTSRNSPPPVYQRELPGSRVSAQTAITLS